MKEAIGKVQEKAGKVTGNYGQQAKGLGKQLGGKVQKTLGDIRDDAEKEQKRRDDAPYSPLLTVARGDLPSPGETL